MTAKVHVLVGDPGSVENGPYGDGAYDAVKAAGYATAQKLPGVELIQIQMGRAHPLDQYPGGSASITVDVAQLGETRDLANTILGARLSAQTGHLLGKSYAPETNTVEFVTVVVETTWHSQDRQSRISAWWPLFSGYLRAITRNYGRNGRDLATLQVSDSSSWLGASTAVPLGAQFTRWPQEDIETRLTRILDYGSYPKDVRTGALTDPAATPSPDGPLPRARRVTIYNPSNRDVSERLLAPYGSLLAEARLTCGTWLADVFWHHGIGDIDSRNSKPRTVALGSGAKCQINWGDMICLAGSRLVSDPPSVTREAFSSPVLFGAVPAGQRAAGDGRVYAAFSEIKDIVDSQKTVSSTLWVRDGEDAEGNSFEPHARGSAYTGDWVQRLGWRIDRRSTLHVRDADRNLAQEFYVLEHCRPARVWQWECRAPFNDDSEFNEEKQLAMAMTSLRHRVGVAIPSNANPIPSYSINVEGVRHRITPELWNVSYTGVAASTYSNLRGWGRNIIRFDGGTYREAEEPEVPTFPSFPGRHHVDGVSSIGIRTQEGLSYLYALNRTGSTNSVQVYNLNAQTPIPPPSVTPSDTDGFRDQSDADEGFAIGMVHRDSNDQVTTAGSYLYFLRRTGSGNAIDAYSLTESTPDPPQVPAGPPAGPITITSFTERLLSGVPVPITTTKIAAENHKRYLLGISGWWYDTQDTISPQKIRFINLQRSDTSPYWGYDSDYDYVLPRKDNTSGYRAMWADSQNIYVLDHHGTLDIGQMTIPITVADRPAGTPSIISLKNALKNSSSSRTEDAHGIISNFYYTGIAMAGTATGNTMFVVMGERKYYYGAVWIAMYNRTNGNRIRPFTRVRIPDLQNQTRRMIKVLGAAATDAHLYVLLTQAGDSDNNAAIGRDTMSIARFTVSGTSVPTWNNITTAVVGRSSTAAVSGDTHIPSGLGYVDETFIVRQPKYAGTSGGDMDYHFLKNSAQTWRARI